MQRYEYRVVPAPRRGEKARGVKSTEDRFALALTSLMNEYGAEGWDYQRADTLPCDERAGLTGTKSTFQHMLVFRRALGAEAAPAPVLLLPEAPVAVPAAPPVSVAAPVTRIAAAEAETALQTPEGRLRLGAALPATNAPQGSTPSVGPARPEVAAG